MGIAIALALRLDLRVRDEGDTSCKLGMGGVRGWPVASPRGMLRSHGHLGTLMREEWPLTLALVRERERKEDERRNRMGQLNSVRHSTRRPTWMPAAGRAVWEA